MSKPVVVLVASLSLASLPLHSQELPTRLEPLDIFRVQVASDPQISPDGKRIVYLRQSADISSDRRVANLWIVNFDGTDHRPLTAGTYSDTSPRWSPDGTRLAFISDRDGSRSQLYVRWMDSGQTAKLTDLENAPAAIAWSPDGKQIAFGSLVSAAPPKIATMPSAPEGAKWADPPRVFEDLIYRFNGPGYLKPGYTQIFVISAEGGPPRQLTTGDFPHGPSVAALGSSGFAWSPDSKSLIFSMNGTTNYEYAPLHTELFELTLADGTLKQLTHRNGPNNAPDISPDGKLIAYTGFDDRYQGHQTTYLYVANRDGTNPHVVTSKLDRDASSPHWSSDGKGIFFSYADQGDTKLAYVPLDGSPKILADHLNLGANFSVSKTNAFSIQYDTPSDSGDVAVASLANPKLNVLTSLNRELFTAKKLGTVEEFWYESSFDKRKIEGWIIKPPDFDSAKNYPLILQIHGGPFSNYGDRFDLQAQIWAAKGYIVLYTNPRGSTSYGEEFANLIHHAYPGHDFEDLNSGVDAILAKGYVDKDNLFVTGGSGGGVLTCWMIDHTDRFRAAASLYPVVNWYSWTLTSDLPSFSTLYWFPGNPWDHTDQYMSRSVISLVKNVKTPTLLMTGDEDFRTPISEAEQYYAALKLLKVESALVRFPGEPHGLTRRPSHSIARTVYTLNWFDSHRHKP